MPRMSAGLLLYRAGVDGVEVLIGHPGGPFWARKDEASWSIPKGEYTEDEDPLAAARREFVEEVGLEVPDGPCLALPPVKQSGGKIVTAFAIEADLDVTNSVSNTFEMEWPKGSGKIKEFPEMDRMAWFSVAEAHVKLLKGQRPLLDALRSHLEG